MSQIEHSVSSSSHLVKLQLSAPADQMTWGDLCQASLHQRTIITDHLPWQQLTQQSDAVQQWFRWNYTLSTVYFANSVASAIPSETQGHSGSPSFVPASVHSAEDINLRDGVSAVNHRVLRLFKSFNNEWILYIFTSFFAYCIPKSEVRGYLLVFWFGFWKQAFIGKPLVIWVWQ